MRLATFVGPKGEPQLGVVRGDSVHAVPGAKDVLDVLDLPPSEIDARAGASGQPLATLTLLAPVVRPRRNVFCVGRNYYEHREEADVARLKAGAGSGAGADEWPAFFTKVPETVVGPDAGVRMDASISDKLDYEAELAVIIGRGGRDIPEGHALEHIFGYTCGNDVTVRDVQRRHGQQWFKGKSFDTHCPLGPTLVTADEIGDPQTLEVICRVNGEEKQRADTEQMIFSVARVIAELSRGMALNPGDVILTGTPGGVGFARQPPEFMKVGDVMEVEIPRVGVLRNRIVAA
jgi:2,4-diketo-3-deoxy-L-fuconate hydrolase